MTMYTYHLARASFLTGLKHLFLPHRLSKIKGLIHAEVMPTMILGSPVFSLSRIVFREVAFFAQWEVERKDFHYEFTTLRFSVISASGEWGVKV